MRAGWRPDLPKPTSATRMRDLFAALARQAETRGRATAFDDGRESLTFGELAARVGGLARELQPLPSIVGLMGRNSVAWIVAQLAASTPTSWLIVLPVISTGPARPLLSW